MGNIAVQWTGGDSQMFIGRDSFGHVAIAGSWPRDDDDSWSEWKGLKPSDMLVMSLASCSAYDVVMILKRQRQAITGVYVSADAEQAPEPPYEFTHIHLHYTVKGENIDPKKVARAIDLSENKYCSVAATIKGVTKITHDFEVQQI